MDSKIIKERNIKIQKSELKSKDSEIIAQVSYNIEEENIEEICDENLATLQKIHAILLNCINLSKKQKLEFAESERYFMKLYLKKVLKQNDKI
ncbi:MAG: hypothetical protein ACFFFT_19605 [Candidatus Thorarchaeota archaeon]